MTQTTTLNDKSVVCARLVGHRYPEQHTHQLFAARTRTTSSSASFRYFCALPYLESDEGSSDEGSSEGYTMLTSGNQLHPTSGSR